VQRWLDAYVHAWETYDPGEIGALFTEDAAYFGHPYEPPMRGREAIIADWLDPARRDPPGSYSGRYEPVAVEGQVAVAHGRSSYLGTDNGKPPTEYDNIFTMRFDDAGLCAEFREWYMERR
jgi:ketosteroid isomerase-like protein